MSRIDEALKRVSERQTPRGIGVADSTMHPADKRSLEAYPLEASAPDPVLKINAPPTRPVQAAPASEGPRPVVHQQPVSNNRLVISATCDRVSVEQYRRMAASLHEAQVGRGLKAVVVTSAVPKEGKTLTAVNLALTFSHSYQRRVLLIDADLHLPSVHELLGIPNERGLSEVLHSARLDLSTTQFSSRLSVLTAGKPNVNPLAGLSSERMGTLLSEAASQYDWVILDTPPLAVLSDAQLLARLTQAVVFVLRAGSTPYAVINKAIEEVGRENVIGTVLNGVEEGAIPVAGYYDHYQNKEGRAEGDRRFLSSMVKVRPL